MKKSDFWTFTLILTILTLTHSAEADPKTHQKIKASAETHDSSTGIVSHFDQRHSLWDEILKEHVKVNGPVSTVAYATIQKTPDKLKRYLKSLTDVTEATFRSWNSNQKLAFLINAYNAFTVKLIVDHYPLESIKDLGNLFSSPWKKKFFYLLGRKMNLDEIEHDIIRKDFAEARIHFAVNCASIGCPALAGEAYVDSKLDQQLEAAAKGFLSDPSRNRFDAKNKELHLSKIFKWYGGDFEKHTKSVESFVASRITDNKEHQKLIRDQKVEIEWTEYDWNLNSHP